MMKQDTQAQHFGFLENGTKFSIKISAHGICWEFSDYILEKLGQLDLY